MNSWTDALIGGLLLVGMVVVWGLALLWTAWGG